MKSVLVTGASGLIGRHALGALSRRGYSVHALSRAPAPSNETVYVQWHRADLMDRSEIRRVMASVRPQALLHLAWTTKHGEFWESRDNLNWTAASLDLLRSFADHGGSRFVGAGTCAEYQWDVGRCDEETTPLRPSSLYGSSKKAFSESLGAYARGGGPSWAWGRVFFLFGPGEDENRLVPYLIRNGLKGLPAVCRFGQLRRDFLFAEDVADAFAALLASEVTGAVNIASGEAIELRRLAETIARCCGDGGTIEVREDIPGANEPLEIGADIRRLREEMQWVPAHTLEQALGRTVEWWRAKLG